MLGAEWIIRGEGAAGAEAGWSGCCGCLDERVVTGTVDKSRLIGEVHWGKVGRAEGRKKRKLGDGQVSGSSNWVHSGIIY